MLCGARVLVRGVPAVRPLSTYTYTYTYTSYELTPPSLTEEAQIAGCGKPQENVSHLCTYPGVWWGEVRYSCLQTDARR